jgi:hypothetical protein
MSIKPIVRDVIIVALCIAAALTAIALMKYRSIFN